jgi:peptidoglycan/LPS O-acetylase OafA/YrhL
MDRGRTIPYEPALDGVRGVSIVAVMAFHACATSGLDGWFRGGNLGVSVFFTLSGFLITSILVTELQHTGRLDLARFWTRRIRRLVPASLTVVLLVVLLSRTALFSARADDAAAATWSFTNWHVIIAGQDQLLRTIVGPLGPTWSLAVEEQFYVLLALGVAVASRTFRPQRSLAIGFGATVVCSVLLANVVSDWHPRLEFGTDVRAAELAIGGLLALVVASPASRVSKRLAALPTVHADMVGVAALATLVGLFLFADYSPPWLLRGGFTIVALTTSAAIISVRAHGRVSSGLAARPLVAVGRWSYALYLVHWPVFLALTADRVGFDGIPLVAVKVAVAFALALVLHHLVEQPVRRSAPQRASLTIGAWLTSSAAVTILALWLL